MLPDAKGIPALEKLHHGEVQKHERGHDQGKGPDVNSSGQADAGVSAAHAPLTLRLHVQGNGVVRVALQVNKQRLVVPNHTRSSNDGGYGNVTSISSKGDSLAHDANDRNAGAGIQQAGGTCDVSESTAASLTSSGKPNVGGLGSPTGGAVRGELPARAAEVEEALGNEEDGTMPAFDPDKEHITGMACGRSHFVMMCEKSTHVPSAGEVGKICVWLELRGSS
jgi:hypothetical protein